MARLARHVHVHHQGGSTVFGPDDEVPEWAAKLITNPQAWAEQPKQTEAKSQPAEQPAKRGPGRPPKSEQSKQQEQER